MTITITTNNHARPLLALAELPAAAQSDFDYLDANEQWTPRLVCYRDTWYDIGEFSVIKPRSQLTHPWAIAVDDDSPLRSWNAAQTQSYWDAIVMRFARDPYSLTPSYDTVVLGHATW